MGQHSTPPDDARTFSLDDRHWRVRGLRRQRGGQRLRASVMVTRGERVHLDTLDLYSARSRRAFVTEAAYALKLLRSEGRLAIACAGRDGATGRQRTEQYEVEGPVAMLLTTTAEEPDAELQNRCLTLVVNEQPRQTAAIHRQQRHAYLHPAD